MRQSITKLADTQLAKRTCDRFLILSQHADAHGHTHLHANTSIHTHARRH